MSDAVVTVYRNLWPFVPTRCSLTCWKTCQNNCRCTSMGSVDPPALLIKCRCCSFIIPLFRCMQHVFSRKQFSIYKEIINWCDHSINWIQDLFHWGNYLLADESFSFRQEILWINLSLILSINKCYFFIRKRAKW